MRTSKIIKHLALFTALVFSLIGCKSNKANNDTYDYANSRSTIEAPSRFVNNNWRNDDETKDYSNDGDEIQEYTDGTYCAEVQYYNPNTSTNSSYTLTVEVEGNEVTQVNFPNGGWLDDDHFSDAVLDDQGLTSFTSDKGYDYEVQIIGKGGGCLANVPPAVQCIGMTRHGRRCRNVTDNPNQLCWQHQSQDNGSISEDPEEDRSDTENDSGEDE